MDSNCEKELKEVLDSEEFKIFVTKFWLSGVCVGMCIGAFIMFIVLRYVV